MLLSDKLIELMRRSGEDRNIAAAARQMDVGYNALLDLRKGRSKTASADYAARIAKHYGVPVEWLLDDAADFEDLPSGWFRGDRAAAKALALREQPASYGDATAAEALVINPNLARRLVGEVKPEHRRTRLAIIHEIEGAFVEAGQGIPSWLEELRREVLGR